MEIIERTKTRWMHPQEIEMCAAIDGRKDFTAECIRSMVECDHRIMLVAEINGRVCGWISIDRSNQSFMVNPLVLADHAGEIVGPPAIALLLVHHAATVARRNSIDRFPIVISEDRFHEWKALLQAGLKDFPVKSVAGRYGRSFGLRVFRDEIRPERYHIAKFPAEFV